jgi:alkylation response protein AidB-like acyl-CoA dehydrogenase
MVVQIQVVIIYSPQDTAARDALSAALRKAGADVWYDAVSQAKEQALTAFRREARRRTVTLALLTREAAALADAGADPKVVHAKASLAKLFASEAAWRCADRVVQVFGGRGYMREFAAERYLRELRVDRIWEGTSEIQRMIVARALEKRGVGRVVG